MTFLAVASAAFIACVVIGQALKLLDAAQRIKELNAEIYDTSRFINRQHAEWEEMTMFGAFSLSRAVELTDELEQKRMELEMTLNEPTR